MENWLKDIRLSKKLTLTDVALSVGVTKQHCSAIESGKRRPSVDVAKAIANVLGFDWEKFYDDGGESAS